MSRRPMTLRQQFARGAIGAAAISGVLAASGGLQLITLVSAILALHPKPPALNDMTRAMAIQAWSAPGGRRIQAAEDAALAAVGDEYTGVISDEALRADAQAQEQLNWTHAQNTASAEESFTPEPPVQEPEGTQPVTGQGLNEQTGERPVPERPVPEQPVRPERPGPGGISEAAPPRVPALQAAHNAAPGNAAAGSAAPGNAAPGKQPTESDQEAASKDQQHQPVDRPRAPRVQRTGPSRAAPRPGDTKPAATKPAATKPAATKPAATEMAATQPPPKLAGELSWSMPIGPRQGALPAEVLNSSWAVTGALVPVTQGSRTVNVGLIRVPQVEDNQSADQFALLFEQLTRSGAQALVIDVTGCPGGQLEQATRILGQLGGPRRLAGVTTSRFRREEIHTPEAGPMGSAAGPTQLPVWIIQDQGTASACELISGTLKDWGLSRSAGEQSYGKGSTQGVMRLGGARLAMISQGQWFTAAGRSPGHRAGPFKTPEAGLKPDLAVPGPQARRVRAGLLQAAAEVQRGVH